MRLPDFHALSLWLNALLLTGAAVAVWVARTRLADYADAIARAYKAEQGAGAALPGRDAAPAAGRGDAGAAAGEPLTLAGVGGSMGRRVVMITGASAGVGRATARRFAARGDAVGLLARGRAGLLAARRDVEAAGGQAVVLEADVADAGQVESAAETLERAFGPIDIWVNNAMASVFSPITETPAVEFERVTAVTYLGVVHGTLRARTIRRACAAQKLATMAHAAPHRCCCHGRVAGRGGCGAGGGRTTPRFAAAPDRLRR